MSPGGQPTRDRAQTKSGRVPRVLYTLKTIIPFDLFPDTLVVDEEKITVVYRWFFLEKQIVSIYYYLLASVVVETDLLFATLRFEFISTDQKTKPLRFLGKRQAEYTRSLIIGMTRLHQKKETDFDGMSINDIITAALNEGRGYLA